MKPIQTLVRAKLEIQAGQENAAPLWVRLWAAYEERGDEGVETLVAELLAGVDGAPVVGGQS